MRASILPFLLLAAPHSMLAQGDASKTPPAQHVTATTIRDSVSGAAKAAGGVVAKVLGDRGSYTYMAIRRDRTGEAEVHAAWDDVIVVQEGAATLLAGGRVSGDRETGPGERRGGQIAGGAARALAAGDLAIVPAGVPHQFRVEPGGSITYLVVKVARPATPAPATKGAGE